MLLLHKPKKKKAKNSKKRSISEREYHQRPLANGTRDRMDLIAPDGIYLPKDPDGYKIPDPKVDLSWIQVGSNRFLRTFVISDLPRQVWVGFLRDLDNLGDVDRSIHFYIPNQQKVVDDLSKEILRLETEAIQRGMSVTNEDALIQQSIADTDALRSAISLGRDKMLYVTIVITIAGETLEDLNRKTKMLYEIAGEKMMRVRECFMRQDDGIRSTAPIAVNALSDIYRNVNLGAATALFPFDTQDLSDPGGLFLGENYYTGTPVFFNNFMSQLDTSHTVIIGRSGSGKTTTVKAMILRSSAQGVRNLVLDPEGEYADVIHRVDGQYFAFNANMEPVINPLDLEAEETADGSKTVDVLSKIEEVKNLFLAMISGFDDRFPVEPEDQALIEQAISQEYLERGITNDPDSLLEPDTREGHVGYKKKEMPTISDIAERLLHQYDAKNLYFRLSPFRRGGTMGIFDGQTKLDIRNAPAIGFGLSALDNSQQLKHFAMLVLTQLIWEKFVKKQLDTPKRVIVDEAWMFTKSKYSLRFFELMSRRARKRNCSFLVSSQSFREFVESNEGQVVLQSAGVTFLMKQASNDLDNLQALYKLPLGQLNFLVSAGKGQGLLRLGAQTTAVQVRIMPHEEPYIFNKAFVS